MSRAGWAELKSQNTEDGSRGLKAGRSVRPHALECTLQQCANFVTLAQPDLARIPVRVAHRQIGSAVKIGRLHAAGLAWLEDFRRAVLKAEAEAARTVGPEALQAAKQALSRYVPPQGSMPEIEKRPRAVRVR